MSKGRVRERMLFELRVSRPLQRLCLPGSRSYSSRFESLCLVPRHRDLPVSHFAKRSYTSVLHTTGTLLRNKLEVAYGQSYVAQRQRKKDDG